MEQNEIETKTDIINKQKKGPKISKKMISNEKLMHSLRYKGPNARRLL